jgi:elongation factor P--(R)-beta-lysine ligase
MPKPSRWWTPALHADRRPLLLARGRIAARLRQWFAERDFFEVETGILQRSPGNETHLHAFATELRGPAGASVRRYLRTSPEFACKKLLAAGERRIFDFARVFRNRERTALHAPEFTLLEWYRANEPYEVLMEDCAALLALAAEGAAATRFSFRDRSIDPSLPPERVSVAEAFQRHAGIDLLATLSDGQTDRDGLAAAAQTAAVQIANDDTWGDIFSRVLVEKIEPRLGIGRATILDEYPAVLSALARASPRDARVAERFELYACGVELANGFGELNDPLEQRRRLSNEMAEKKRLYGESYPLDEDFLDALGAMPPASGIALGFDRLVMLATGASRIDQVLWTPPIDPAN